jgi:hypothetical protein
MSVPMGCNTVEKSVCVLTSLYHFVGMACTPISFIWHFVAVVFSLALLIFVVDCVSFAGCVAIGYSGRCRGVTGLSNFSDRSSRSSKNNCLMLCFTFSLLTPPHHFNRTIAGTFILVFPLFFFVVFSCIFCVNFTLQVSCCLSYILLCSFPGGLIVVCGEWHSTNFYSGTTCQL